MKRCEYFGCEESFEGNQPPEGWSQYGKTRFIVAAPGQVFHYLSPHLLANWCPKHSTIECAEESERLVAVASQEFAETHHEE